MIWGRADVIIVEIKITTNITCLNYPKPSPSPALWKIFLPQNQSPVPQRLGTSVLYNIWCCLFHIESVITSLTLKKRSLLYQSVQWLSCVQLFATPWTAAHQASLSITNSWSLLRLMSIELVMPSNHLILCLPILLMPQSFPESGQGLSQRVGSSQQVAKVLELQHQSFQWIFRTDFL